MIRPAPRPLRGTRTAPLDYVIEFRGLNLTGADLAAQVRQKPDNPGLPEIDLVDGVSAGATGLRLIGTPEQVEGVWRSRVGFFIAQADMENIPAAAEIGDALTWYYDLQITPAAGVKATYLRGDFVIEGGATNTATASTGSGAGLDAIVTVTDETVVVEVEGAELLAPLVEQAEAAAASSEGFAADAADERAAAEAAAETFNAVNEKATSALALIERQQGAAPARWQDLPDAGMFADRVACAVRMNGQRARLFNAAGAQIVSGTPALIRGEGCDLAIATPAALIELTATSLPGSPQIHALAINAGGTAVLDGEAYLDRVRGATSAAFSFIGSLATVTNGDPIFSAASFQIYVEADGTLVVKKIDGGSSCRWRFPDTAGLMNLASNIHMFTLEWQAERVLAGRFVLRVDGEPTETEFHGDTPGYDPTEFVETGDVPQFGDAGNAMAVYLVEVGLWAEPRAGEIEQVERRYGTVDPAARLWWTRPIPVTGLGPLSEEWKNRALTPSWAARPVIDTDWGDNAPLTAPSSPNVISGQTLVRSDTDPFRNTSAFIVVPDWRDPTNNAKRFAIAGGGRRLADADNKTLDFQQFGMILYSTNADTSSPTFDPVPVTHEIYSFTPGTSPSTPNNLVADQVSIPTGGCMLPWPMKMFLKDTHGVKGPAGAFAEFTIRYLVSWGAYADSTNQRIQAVEDLTDPRTWLDPDSTRNPMGHDFGTHTPELGSAVGESRYFNGVGIQETKEIFFDRSQNRAFALIRPQFNLPDTPKPHGTGVRQVMLVGSASTGIDGVRCFDDRSALLATPRWGADCQAYQANMFAMDNEVVGMIVSDYFADADLGDTGSPPTPVLPAGDSSGYLESGLTLLRSRRLGYWDFELVTPLLVDTAAAEWKFLHVSSVDWANGRLYVAAYKTNHGAVADYNEPKIISLAFDKAAWNTGTPAMAIEAAGERIRTLSPCWGGNVLFWRCVCDCGPNESAQFRLLDYDAWRRGEERVLPGFDFAGSTIDTQYFHRVGWSSNQLNPIGPFVPPDCMVVPQIRTVSTGNLRFGGGYAVYRAPEQRVP